MSTKRTAARTGTPEVAELVRDTAAPSPLIESTIVTSKDSLSQVYIHRRLEAHWMAS